ncbi:bifunctional diguanylate cyclase/phosphodiesterase [Sphingomonas flavescens]|uniref:putative bifunctional diguanylate cyclase/phosphodiesterase n=1 Tax=Sphingomonas flavescens TaxID=3132797 RepID=UPI0028044A2D|nr:bifunctional diguanylate cyclase/phosphodiesterase [Sphingomonas limnosediminicola]
MSKANNSRLINARRDVVVLAVLITAVMMLIWNGSSFFHRLNIGGAQFGPQIRLASTALTLNVALILFGWRRYVDLQHEAEMRAEHERRAVVLATTDTITGLYNRKGFADRGGELCVEAAERGDEMVVISFQIHRFKTVNDQHGYETGDRLLKTISVALADELGPDSVLARLSGDEFAVALALADDQISRADKLAENVLKIVTKPLLFDDKIIQVGAFAGIASARGGDVRIPDLLRRADIAMDHARSGRTARPIWFDAGMERALIAQSEIEQGIRVGLDHGQFVPFFEPQVDLSTGQIVGFEMLARWNHPLSGMIGPDVFIAVAEEIGLIGRLSEHVIAEALREAANWDPSIKISVNISPFQLADGWLAQRIVRTLADTGFPAERLVIEITESSLFADIDLARTIVTSLKNQGIRLALDDFGTGFSSLAHLRSLPFDIIKIDRSFVTQINAKRENTAIVRAVSTLAKALQVPVCVEGIENEESYRTVVQLGCEIGQGWYFGKAMPAEAAREMLNARERNNEVPFRSVSAG